MILFIASLGLAACDQAQTPASVEAAPEISAAVGAAPEHKPQAPVDADQDAAVAGKASASERILNLSYAPSPEDEVGPGNPPQPSGQKDMLPDMFDPQKKAGNISLSGGLLTDPEKEEYIDSVNGAEVSIKMRTR